MPPDFDGSRQYALERLAGELPAYLYYHSYYHTRYDVVEAVERLAPLENVNGNELVLLRTAAYFHDVGFVEQIREHEQVSARIARQVLPDFRYSGEEVELISQLIMATRLPQNPQTQLERIIVDADMDSLGREDFMQRSQALRREWEEALHVLISDADWYNSQINFLRNHRYYTESARRLRDAGKLEHIDQLNFLLERLKLDTNISSEK